MRWIDRFRMWPWLKPSIEGSPENQALQWVVQGHAFEDTGEYAQAMQCYEAAISVAQNLPQAHLSRGNCCLAMGQTDEALAAYATALVHNPEYAAAHYNSGNALLHLNRQEDALIAYAKAIELKPDFADAHFATGCVLEDLQRFADAEVSYRRALEIRPNYAEVLSNLGRTLNELGRFDEAIACFRKVLELKPVLADAHCTLGGALLAAGQTSEAIEQYRWAIEIDQFNANARWALAMAHIRPIYDEVAAIEKSRSDFAHAIADLDAWFTPARVAMGAKFVGSHQPFFLAYQSRDNRALLESYGRLCARLMSNGADKPMQSCSTTARKLRIGVASAHVRDHSVWIAITKGWIRHFNPARFEVLVFHLGRFSDGETMLARTEATDFIDKPRTLDSWTRTIKEAQLDVLIYPEIGMDVLTTQLAAKRLAPVQAASWGHPQTTGLPTIDLFLSANLFEPQQGDAHYTEKLVRLPNLGVCVERLAPPSVAVDLKSMGLPIEEPLLLCPGVAFKYSPEHDDVWVALGMFLQTQGAGRLVFFRGHRVELMNQFEQRLRRTFLGANVDFDRTVCLIPTLSRDQFYGLMQRSTLMLDTIGFSGFNTALQGLECGLPLVAYEDEFMRGRLASGLLRRIGLDDWVATSKPDFIDMAMRLTTDRSLRGVLSQQIAQRCVQIFNDLEPVRALESVLVDAVAQSASLLPN